MLHRIICGSALGVLRSMKSGVVQSCITSPPYWGARSYLPASDPAKAVELGQEESPSAYVAALVAVFRELRRVLRDDGTFWLNIGDCYVGGNNTDVGGNANNTSANGDDDEGYMTGVTDGSRVRAAWTGLPRKNRIGIPHRLVFALQEDGWIWRDEIIWHKLSTMPTSVKDRTTPVHEFLFMLSKTQDYYFDADAIAELATSVEPDPEDTRGEMPTRNKRSVWTLPPEPYIEPGVERHIARFPQALVEPCILAGSKKGSFVLDPFAGSGTVGVVALRHARRFIGIELNSKYANDADRRIAGPLFAQEASQWNTKSL